MSRWSGSGPTWRRVYWQDGPIREARRPPSLSERLGGGAAIAPRPRRATDPVAPGGPSIPEGVEGPEWWGIATVVSVMGFT